MSAKYIVDELQKDILEALDLPPESLNPDTNLLKLGFDSIDIMAALSRLRKVGIELTMLDLYQNPTLAGWSALLMRDGRKRAVTHQLAPTLTMSDGEPFPLTPVQHAYLVGRSPQQVLGGVGCHLYQEFDGEALEPEHLETAMCALVERHPMLRVHFRQDGTQQLVGGKKGVKVRIHDLRRTDAVEREEYLLDLRHRLAHRLMDVEQGETFEVQLSLLPDRRHRLHTNIDLLIADAASYSILLEDLAGLVSGDILPETEDGFDFRSYLVQREASSTESREKAKTFWGNQLAQLPPAPALPLLSVPEKLEQVRIARRTKRLDSSLWRKFRDHAGMFGITSPMALATCYGAVMGRWSGQEHILLNLTLFDRQPLHPSVARMVADFTNVLLLDLKCSGRSFEELARSNQHTFASCCDHAEYSGVEVMRDLKKLQRHPYGAPIVFTSNIGRSMLADNIRPVLGELGWGISQTPQVWIDHQALEDQDTLLLQWDSNDELFHPGFIDTLFHVYVGLVEFLARNADAWAKPLPDPVPDSQWALRKFINSTQCSLPGGLLHEGFFRQAELTPQATALIAGQEQLSYGKLSEMARRLAGALQDYGVLPGQLVAISISRGIGQIVAVLATLYAGATYVPVSLDQPFERRAKIYQMAGISVVLTSSEEQDLYEWQVQPLRVCWQEAAALKMQAVISNQQPAYVIYTSGSTGTPKGVAISHQSALNTCLDINRRNDIGPQDRLLAISALHFDLSVYDIFGILGSGGALVLLSEKQRRDPETWCRLIERHSISIWNSVPALFDMLLTYCEGFGLQSPAALRTIMLSGDWIGLDLPARYRSFRRDGAFVGMGGATEAAIWSNYFEVSEVSRKWRSIPYGFPLTNQSFRVVDDMGRDCPDWVPGELWIGGAGVALGYLNDPERTSTQFIELEGERWYRTGDLGCYWPDGTLEFLGRRDRQVKVGGYRIELEEIDAALTGLEGVKSGITLALGDRDKSLASFVVVAPGSFCRYVEADAHLPSDYSHLFPRPKERSASAQNFDNLTTQLAGSFLREHLALHGLEFTCAISLQSCIETYGALSAYDALISRWLKLLTSLDILHGDEMESYRQGPTYHLAASIPSADEATSLLYEALLSHHSTLTDITQGRHRPETLLNHPFWSPEALQLRIPGTSEVFRSFADGIVRLSQTLKRPVTLIELGARSGMAAAQLLSIVDPVYLHYVALDESQEMILRLKARCVQHTNLSALRWDEITLNRFRHKADIVWANNYLHRLASPHAGLGDMAALATPGAMLAVHEIGVAPALALISVDLLPAQGNIASDQLKNHSSWLDLFRSQGLICESADRYGDLSRFILRTPAELKVRDPEALRKALAMNLPSYMVPQRLYFLENIPLTPNGKIDHKALAEYCSPEAGSQIDLEDEPGTEEEATLSRLWQALLEVSPPQRTSNFFELGGDSLLATRLIGELNRAGYAAQLGNLFTYPSLGAFAATLRKDSSSHVITSDTESRYVPFPLTEVQQAYLAGRDPAFPLGGVGSHFFMEFEVQHLDVERFESVWNRLIARHDMLRVIVHEGKQQVLKDVPRFTVVRHLLDGVHSQEGDAIRDRLSHQVLNPEVWPVFSVQVAQDRSHVSRVFIGLDNLLLDGLSMQILMDELTKLYADASTILPAIEIGFRDYILDRAKKPESPAASAYWQHRLKELPPAPQLPLRRDPADVRHPRFIRLSDRLSASHWAALRTRAATMHLTPSSFLLTAYAAVLSAWSRRQDLSINVTFFDREPIHPHIDRVLGDFTSLLVLAWKPAESWIESARKLQMRLQQDMANRDLSTIRIVRSLTRERGALVAFPVVFTSALGYDRSGGLLSRSSWLKPTWGVSQTPQTWLDHQVYESDGELVLNWDVVEALFDTDMLRAIFAQYVNLLHRLSEDDACWKMRMEELLPKHRFPHHLPQADISDRLPLAARTTPVSITLVDGIRRLFEQETHRSIRGEQNFFDAGATSLDLVRLHVRCVEAGYSTLEVTDLFTYPSPITLAEKLHESDAGAASRNDPDRKLRLDQRAARRIRRTAAP